MRHSDTQPSKRQSAPKIPAKPRDCGPHVDTWPILDAEAGDAPKSTSQGPQARTDKGMTQP